MLALISLDGDFDLPQDLFAGHADRRAEDADRFRGVEVEDGLEVLVAEITGGVKPAAAHQRIGGADSPGVFEYRSQVVFIIVFEERTVNDTEEVPSVLLPPAFDQLSGDGLQLKSQADASGLPKTLFQRGGHAVLMLRAVFPKKRRRAFAPPPVSDTSKTYFIRGVSPELSIRAILLEPRRT